MLQLPPFRCQTNNAAVYAGAAVLPADLDLNFLTMSSLDPRITFSRTSAATYFNSSGVLTTATSGAARLDYNPVALSPKGLLIEEARTNVVWPNRDLTHARWVKTNCTAALNQTGIDGGANSASSLTATAANATCLQTTSASSTRYQSAYVKRLTGTGVVNMTMNGGTTWTPITVTASWTRVEIPSASVTNPVVGFQLVTSGDAIAVDCVQNENGGFATSAMITSSGTFARAADVATMTGTNFSSWYNQTAGTFVAEFDLLTISGARAIMEPDAGTSAEVMDFFVNAGAVWVQVVDGGVGQVAFTNLGSIAVATVGKVGLSYALNDFAGCLNGGTVRLDTAGTLPTPTQLRIGADSNVSNVLNGHVRRIQFFNTAKSDAELQALTA